MDIGAFMLPGLALLIAAALVYVTAAWVFDGTKAEQDISFLAPDPDDIDRKSGPKYSKRR